MLVPLFAQPKTNWKDGIAQCIHKYNKENLNNPKSETWVASYKLTYISQELGYYQRYTFRAKNIYGALERFDFVYFMIDSGSDYKVYKVLTYQQFQAMF